jgi:UDP-N-acetyl-D-mannosaminuronate dehydrogenase
MKKISFIGLGKLGLPLATTLAKNKNQVIAIDKNEDLIRKLNAGRSPWIENQLQENIEESLEFIEYTTD